MIHARTGLLSAVILSLGLIPVAASAQEGVPLRSNAGSSIFGSSGDGGSTVVSGSVGTLSAGDGLMGGGDMTSDQSVWMDPDEMRLQVDGSDDQGVVQYTGTYPMSGSFYGGSNIPTNTNSANRLNYDGPLAASEMYSTQYFYHSDRRLKQDIEALDGISALNMIGRMDPVSYRWTSDGRDAMGLIAQDVVKTHPFLVATDPNGMMSVDYTQIIAPLIAAVQELEARNRDLSERVEALEGR